MNNQSVILSGVSNRGSVGGGSTISSSRGRGVLGLSGVGHLSNVAGQVVGVVGDGLDPAVGQVDGVGAGHGASAIVGLGLLEGNLGVVVSDGVGVGVGGGLGQVGGVAGRGSSVVDRSSTVLGGSGGSSHEGEGDEGLR